MEATIVFEPEFRNPTALKGLEDFSHIWLIWEFSKAVRDTWSPTVRPPRLGGNKRIGVFATRSPFRPNPIGISCVELKGIDLHTAEGPVLHVLGADMVNNTPIYDIKPYLPAVDSYPNATGGFTDLIEENHWKLIFRSNGFSSSLGICKEHFFLCLHRIRGRLTKMIRSAFTASSLVDLKLSSWFRTTDYMSEKFKF